MAVSGELQEVVWVALREEFRFTRQGHLHRFDFANVASLFVVPPLIHPTRDGDGPTQGTNFAGERFFKFPTLVGLLGLAAQVLMPLPSRFGTPGRTAGTCARTRTEGGEFLGAHFDAPGRDVDAH